MSGFSFSRYFGRLRRERRRGSLLRLRELVRTRRNRLEGEMRRRAQFAYLGNNIGLCRVLGRFKMFVDTRDIGLSSHLALDGYWELWVTEFLAARLRRGMTVVDIGANLGYFTVIMAEMVGDEGVVHAFEPNLPIAKMMRHSVHVNGFLSRVRFHAEALSDVNGGHFRMEVPENFPGGAWLTPAEAHYDGPLTEVRRFDSYPELVNADIIKIDAEGAEHRIWHGMRGILELRRPLIILVEFVLARYENPASFLEEIESFGFEIHQISDSYPLRLTSKEEILGWPVEKDGMLVLIRS